MADFPLCCNGCWNKLQNKALKTSCDHCYCEICAETLFSDRRRRCSSCNSEVTGILEFQIVGAPILDDQLIDVRATLQAIACANGTSSLDSWISGLHRFERIQTLLWGSRQGQSSMDSLRIAEEREKELAEKELQARQLISTMELQCEQTKKERDQAQHGLQDLQLALEERSRQAENWRAMYEALKNGGRVSIPAAPTLSSSNRPLTLTNNNNNNNNGTTNLLMRSDTSSSSLGQRISSFQPPQQQGFDNNRFETRNNRSGSIISESNSNFDFQRREQQQGGQISGFRSNSVPLRPPTRDSLSSLLNRSVAPRTTTSFTSRPPTIQQEQVRSTFFAPASLRAVSPSILQNRQQNNNNERMLY